MRTVMEAVVKCATIMMAASPAAVSRAMSWRKRASIARLQVRSGYSHSKEDVRVAC